MQPPTTQATTLFLPFVMTHKPQFLLFFLGLFVTLLSTKKTNMLEAVINYTWFTESWYGTAPD